MGNKNAIRFQRNELNGVMSVTKDMIIKHITETMVKNGAVEDGEIVIGRYREDNGKVMSVLGVGHNGSTGNGTAAGVTIIGENGSDITKAKEELKEYVDEKTSSLDSGDIAFSFANPSRKEDNVSDAINALETEIRQVEGDYVANVKGEGAVKSDITRGTDGKKNASVSLKINENDKILSQSSNGLSANITLSYDAKSQTLSIKGRNGDKIGDGVDMSEFMKDNMLDNVELITPTPADPVVIHGIVIKDGMYLKFTWKTNGENKPLYVNMTQWMEDMMRLEYKEGYGISIEDRTISLDLSEDSTTVKYLYIDDLGKLAFRDEEIKKLADMIGEGGYFLKDLFATFLPLTGGTMVGDTRFVNEKALEFGGNVNEEGKTKISQKDGGLAVSINNGDGYEEKAGVDSDGEIYTIRDGEKERIDDVYLRKSEYNDGGKEYKYLNEDNDDFEDSNLKVIAGSGNLLLSVKVTVGEVVVNDETDEGIVVPTDTTYEDIVWLNFENWEESYCSKNTDLYVLYKDETRITLFLKKGIIPYSASVKVLHGEAYTDSVLVKGNHESNKKVYPHICEWTYDSNPENMDGNRPVFEIFEASGPCEVEVTITEKNSEGREVLTSDTIHINRCKNTVDTKLGDDESYRDVHCDTNYGLFRWLCEGSRVKVYMRRFRYGVSPQKVTLKTTYGKIVEPKFEKTTEDESKFYLPVPTLHDITDGYVVHARSSDEFLDAVYALSGYRRERSVGTLMVDGGINMNWIATHTILEKNFYKDVFKYYGSSYDELGKEPNPESFTDGAARLVNFGSMLDNVVITSPTTENSYIKIYNVYGPQQNDKTGVLGGDSAFITTIRANKLKFKNIWFGNQYKKSYTLKDGTVVDAWGDNIGLLGQSEHPTSQTQSGRSMFEIGESLTMDGCRVDIQGVDGDINTFQNNPLVTLIGNSSKKKATVKLSNCDFTSPFVADGRGTEEMIFSDTVLIADGITDEANKVESCDVVIDGCNVVTGTHKSTDSVVKLVKGWMGGWEKTTVEGETESKYTWVFKGIASPSKCRFNIHRDSMKAEYDEYFDGMVTVLPDNNGKNVAISDESGTIDVTSIETDGVTTYTLETKDKQKVEYVSNIKEFLKAVKKLSESDNTDTGFGKVIRVIGDIDFAKNANGYKNTDYGNVLSTNTTETVWDFGSKLDDIIIEGYKEGVCLYMFNGTKAYAIKSNNNLNIRNLKICSQGQVDNMLSTAWQPIFQTGRDFTIKDCNIHTQWYCKNGVTYDNTYEPPMAGDKYTAKGDHNHVVTTLTKPEYGDYCRPFLKITGAQGNQEPNIIIDNCMFKTHQSGWKWIYPYIGIDIQTYNDSNNQDLLLTGTIKITDTRVQHREMPSYNLDGVNGNEYTLPSGLMLWHRARTKGVNFTIYNDGLKVKSCGYAYGSVPNNNKVYVLDDQKIVSLNKSIAITELPNKSYNLEVYEGDDPIIYAKDINEFLEGVKKINETTTKSGMIRIGDTIDMTKLMEENSQLGTHYGLTCGDGYVDFGDKLNGIIIEGYTSTASIKTIPVATSKKDIIKNPGELTSFNTNGMIMGGKITIRNARVGRSYEPIDFAEVSKSGKFRWSINPLFTVKTDLKMENCEIFSQNCRDGRINGENIKYPGDGAGIDDQPITLVRFRIEGSDGYGSGGNSNGNGGNTSGMTLTLKDCEFRNPANYAGDAQSTYQDTIESEMEFDETTQDSIVSEHEAVNGSNNRNFNCMVKYTNCRIIQQCYKRESIGVVNLTKAKIRGAGRKINISTFKGNLNDVKIEYDKNSSDIETSKLNFIQMD